MGDVNETLQDLLERRLKEMGQRRGRGEAFSLHEAYERYEKAFIERNRSEDGDHPKVTPTYEVFRRIRNGHTNITEGTADALATMLDVDVNEVLAAAGQRPRLGRFELPRRADQLNEKERGAVLGVIDAILDAGAADTNVVQGKFQVQQKAARHPKGRGK